MTSHAPYILVLTHDVELLSLRELPWRSRTLWGFVVRSVFANLARVLRRQISVRQYLLGFLWGLFMPLVKSGLLNDPIDQSFKTMLDIERKHGVRSTLYFVTEPGRPGITPNGRKAPGHRAVHYRIGGLRNWLCRLEEEGWEIGVHGIDSYRELTAAHREFQSMCQILGHKQIGHRSHWLYSKGRHSWDILRRAGFDYDSSYGSNYVIGWPDGRRWPFRPFASRPFTVLPLNIQDGALLDPIRIGLDPDKARKEIYALVREARERGAVITVLWHTHSFCAPRYWRDLYERIILQAKADDAAILPAKEALAIWRHRGEPSQTMPGSPNQRLPVSAISISPETIGAGRGGWGDGGDREIGRSKRLKVVVFSTVHRAADDRIFHKESRSLAWAGYDVVLFVPTDHDDAIAGVRIRALPQTPRRLQRALSSLKLLPQLLREKGDIYHFHDPELLVVGLILRALGRKVIYDAHEDLPKDILGKTYLAPWLRAILAAIIHPLERWAAHRMTAVVTARDSTRKRLRGTLVLNNYPILEYVRQSCQKVAPAKQYKRFVVYFGTITRPLGAREMLLAVSAVSGRLPLKLKLLGVFEDNALRDELLSSSASSVVDYGGFVAMPEVYREYHGALAGLVLYHHPNHMETAANKLFECMASGVPLIVCDFPLWRRMVYDQGCGLVVDPLDVPQIADAIIYLLEHPDEAKKMGQRGKELVEKKYNWESESKKLLLLYEHLLGKR